MCKGVKEFEKVIKENFVTPFMSRLLNRCDKNDVVKFLLEGESAGFNIHLTDTETYLRKILGLFIDAKYILKSIKMSSVFIKQYPYKKTLENNNISKVDCLKYHLYACINNYYELHERVKKMCNITQKHYNKLKMWQEKKQVETYWTKIEKAIRSAGKNSLMEIRGMHVHAENYIDKELSRLEHADIIKEDFLIDFYDNLYRKERRRKVQFIKKIHETAQLILEGTLREIVPYIKNLRQQDDLD